MGDHGSAQRGHADRVVRPGGATRRGGDRDARDLSLASPCTRRKAATSASRLARYSTARVLSIRRSTSRGTHGSRPPTANGSRSSRSTASAPSYTGFRSRASVASSAHKGDARVNDAWLRQSAAECAELSQASIQGAGVADRLTVGVAARLSRYLQVLTQAKKMGKDRISSQEISDYTNINATQIRRDLSGFGKFGKRGVGYNIDSLLGEIRKILRTQGQHNIALVGAGRLGQAIASSPIFAEHGINIAAVFDKDPEKVGSPVGNVVVSEYSELPGAVHDKNIIVGVIAVPAIAAQSAADDLVAAGVKIVFNYSEALLETPADVTVHTSNPAVELLYALYFHLT